MSHTHRWAQFYEAGLIGGSFPVGWKCLDCNEWVNQGNMTPAGLTGTILKEKHLSGPHGGRGNCENGDIYKEQILHEDGRLEIIGREERPK